MLNVVQFPQQNVGDVAAALRRLADGVEKGEFGAHNVAWVMDTGGGAIEVGLIGPAPEPKSATHLLLAMGMRKLELL